MDALSSLLEDVHLRHAEYYYIHGHGNWAFRLAPPDHIMAFYVVLTGVFDIHIQVGAEAKQVATQAGDMLMLPQSAAHLCQSTRHVGTPLSTPSPAHKTQMQQHDDAPNLLERLPRNNNEPIQLGDGYMNTQAILVLCEYDQDMAKPLLSALPPILPEKPPANQSIGEQEQTTRGSGFGSPIMRRVTNSLSGAQHFNIHSEVLKIGLAYLSVETRVNRLGKSTMLNRLISMLMVECLREHIESLDKTSDSWLYALKDAQLAKAIARMHAEPHNSWTIASLAEVAGMSRSSFAERFKVMVGQTPLAYLTSYRLRLAARFLRLEQYSIGRISELTGYASDSTFSQAFKREYGVSPMQYRQAFIKQ